MDYNKSIEVTLTYQEWELITAVLEREGFFKIHSYNSLFMAGACNYITLAEKINRQIK